VSRFYVRPEDVRGDEVLVSKEEAHHIANVMRMVLGDKVVAFDGTGKEYVGTISDVSKEGLRIKISRTNEVNTSKKIHVSLAQALPKKAKMDSIVEKSTELGVDEIVPLVTERTIVKITQGKRDDKRTRWQNIAISASKQCGRLDVPEVKTPVRFKDFLDELEPYDTVMMACLSEETTPIKDCISNLKHGKILVMVGPEGDFSPGEIESAKSRGAKLISLGRLVLKSDTAGLYILSVLNYENSGV